ncbi:ABC transporter permease [Devosia algicola]|uniref:ABC transporter permease n=1 Tax=Devosia algicola TaxID=3026418 RepID=A0ABY7YJL2_9HYPH|nr:ABC transporter permease [Devosia algicola]
MRALYKKLLREIWRQRGQMISIAAVVAVGIMTVLTMRGAYESLASSQADYYSQSRFPTVWASLERAPESVRRRIEELPGVAAVDTRVTFTATLDIAGLDAPAVGKFVSVPASSSTMLSALTIMHGRYLSDRRGEVIISDKFAQANAFSIGDRLEAVINGRLRSLTIVGTAISPEHIYSVPPGSLFPDDKIYGIVWMARDQIGPAYDMAGAFNEVALTTAPGANLDRLVNALDRLLEPYGGRGAYLRADQPSHQLVQSEPGRCADHGHGDTSGIPRGRSIFVESCPGANDQHPAQRNRGSQGFRLFQSRGRRPLFSVCHGGGAGGRHAWYRLGHTVGPGDGRCLWRLFQFSNIAL